ncbi:MAG: hypothetical protein PHU25_00500 [Deltaproteobacteria bacterium]|nr:hypothetical protein [Deltaproteobacteria bacterium]
MKKQPGKPGEAWTRAERVVFARLTDPPAVQAFLDEVPYSADPIYRSPRSVLRDRRAHCVDGALFAAAALRRLGFPPLVMELCAERDDDHVIAVFEKRGRLGAVAKSNFSGLRFREPVFRTPRELAMSYFEQYYNVDGEKTLRACSSILDLRKLDSLDWMTRDEGLEAVIAKLEGVRHTPLVSKAMVAALSHVDERSYRAGMLGASEAGLWKPGKGG